MRGVASGFGYLWLSRLHSITGLVFAIAFVCCFLLPYSSIFSGPSSFDAAMAERFSAPMLGLAQVAFILIPLIYHAAYGLMIVHGSQINAFKYGYYRNWMYALERVAGLLLIPFVIYHIYRTELASAVGAGPLSSGYMHALFASGWSKGVYAAGIVIAAFYIGNGLAMQSSVWGAAASRRARGAAIVVGWIVTTVLTLWGLRIILSF